MGDAGGMPAQHVNRARPRVPVQRAVVELLHDLGPKRLAARSVLHVLETLGLIPLGLVGLGVPVVHLTLLQGHKQCAAAVVKNSTVCGHGTWGATGNAGLLARAQIPVNLLRFQPCEGSVVLGGTRVHVGSRAGPRLTRAPHGSGSAGRGTPSTTRAHFPQTHRVFELLPREAREHLRTTEQEASGAAKADHHAGSGAPGPASIPTLWHTSFCSAEVLPKKKRNLPVFLRENWPSFPATVVGWRQDGPPPRRQR